MPSITDKYRPQTLADLLGQPWAVNCLESYLETPHSSAFLFAGETGTGKSSAAYLVARELGIEVDEGPFGGFYQIASGEQTGESVRRMIDQLHMRPFLGSGWRCLIVNEADAMTPNAAHVWLDALENLPRQTLIVFTTNNARRIPQRLRDRCETVQFESRAMLLRPALQEYCDKLWLAETGQAEAPEVEAFGPLADAEGNASFRRLAQAMAPYLRTGRWPEAREEEEPAVSRVTGSRSEAARKAWATRRARAKVGGVR